MFSAHNSVLFFVSRRGEVQRLRLSLGDPELARGRHTVRRHRSVFSILTDACHTLLLTMLLPIVMRVCGFVRLSTWAHLMGARCVVIRRSISHCKGYAAMGAVFLTLSEQSACKHLHH